MTSVVAGLFALSFVAQVSLIAWIPDRWAPLLIGASLSALAGLTAGALASRPSNRP